MASIVDRFKHAWNAFRSADRFVPNPDTGGISYTYRPDRPRLSRGNERSIVTSVLNRIAMDAAALAVKHVRLDEEGRYKETINSGLNECLNLSANIDQTGRAFLQDVYLSLLDEGHVAIVPVDTDVSPINSNSYEILSLRVGKVVEWYPQSVRISLYNERVGRTEEIVLPKTSVAIIENPMYAVMNEPNSTLQRLIRKLNMLDVVDEQTSSGKLDMIIQLPYVIKTEARQQQAEIRRKKIEEQLTGSRYGIAYIDGTERITQLNRAVDNNLMSQIEYLTSMLYSQLGISTAVLDGTADEAVMNNYYTRTVEPPVSALCDGIKRTFLTKTARTQGQSIMFFRDPFKLMPTSSVAEIADKFTRNEILSPNEIRQIIGRIPSSDPESDVLRNRNINQSNEEQRPAPAESEERMLDEVNE